MPRPRRTGTRVKLRAFARGRVKKAELAPFSEQTVTPFNLTGASCVIRVEVHHGEPFTLRSLKGAEQLFSVCLALFYNLAEDCLCLV